ncbi:hypothetical protein T03_15281, partial [Trichinella britovi]
LHNICPQGWFMQIFYRLGAICKFFMPPGYASGYASGIFSKIFDFSKI